MLCTEDTCDVFGSKLREQVEDRLKFYESGDIPRKNVDVMHEALAEAQAVLVISTMLLWRLFFVYLYFLKGFKEDSEKEEEEEDGRFFSSGGYYG